MMVGPIIGSTFPIKLLQARWCACTMMHSGYKRLGKFMWVVAQVVDSYEVLMTDLGKRFTSGEDDTVAHTITMFLNN